LDGTWERILEHVVVKDDSVGTVVWEVSIDSSVVRAHDVDAGALGRDRCAGLPRAARRLRIP
jgi:hypothetical protein